MAIVRDIETRVRLASDTCAVDFFAPYFDGLDEETLLIAHLDASQRLLGLRSYRSNLCDAVELPMRHILSDTLSLGGAGLICAHNHPSGDPAPSRNDLVVTRTLSSLLRAIKVQLHDHLIFADGETRSFRALGLL